MATAFLPNQPGGYPGNFNPITVGYSHYWVTIAGLTLSNVGTNSCTYAIADAALAAGGPKRYFETTINATSGGSPPMVGVIPRTGRGSAISIPGDTGAGGVTYRVDGTIYYNGSLSSVSPRTPVAGDVIGTAIDPTSGDVSFYYNGTFIGTVNATLDYYDPHVSPFASADSYTANFGATPFAYTPPTGYSGFDSSAATYTLTATAGSFAGSGQAAAVRVARKVAAASRSFVESGQAAFLKRGLKLAAAPAAFALTGVGAAVRRSRAIVVAASAFALAGQPAIARKASVLPAAKNAFSLNGQNASFRLGHGMLGGVGAFSLTGSSAALKVGRRLAPSAGSCALAGPAAQLRLARALLVQPTTFAWTGNAASLTKTSAGALPASPGSIAVGGQPVSMVVSRRLYPAATPFAGIGNSPILRAARRAPIATGTFAASGQTAPVRAVRYLAAQRGPFSAGTPAASALLQRRLPSQCGQFFATGIDVAMRLGSGAPLPDVAPFFAPLLTRSFVVPQVTRTIAVTVRRIVQ